MAGKFRELEGERRELEAEHLALQWRGLDERAEPRRPDVSPDQQSRLDAELAGQRRIEAELEKARSEHTEAVDAYNSRYRSVIEAGAEVARTEESIHVHSPAPRRNHPMRLARRDRACWTTARRQIETERREREEIAERASRATSRRSRICSERVGGRAWRELSRYRGGTCIVLQVEFEALSEREHESARTAHAEQDPHPASRIGHRASSRRGLGRWRPSAAENDPGGVATRGRAGASPTRRDGTRAGDGRSGAVARARDAVQSDA